MGKDQDLLQAVKEQDVFSLQRILAKNRAAKSSKYCKSVHIVHSVAVFISVAQSSFLLYEAAGSQHSALARNMLRPSCPVTKNN